MPSGLVSPLSFGICTRRTGGARYRPVFARSSSDSSLGSNPCAYSAALCPSTPVAPSLRVRRYASCSHATSMWWASVVSASVGASLASFAIRSSFVEMFVELGVSSIVPSFGSPSRCRPLLSWLPLRWFACFSAPTAALRLPAPPRRSLYASLRGSVFYGGNGISQVPRQPLPHMPRSPTPVEPTRAGLRDFVPTFCSLGFAFRVLGLVGFHDFQSFGAQ